MTITGSTAGGSTGTISGIYITLTDILVISNTTSNSNAGVGVYLAGDTHVTMTNVTANTNVKDGLYVLHSGVVNGGSTTLTGGTFSGNSVGSISYNGLTLFGNGDGFTATNVTAANNGGDGFNVHGTWANVTIDHCTADTNGTTGGSSDGDGFSFHETASGIIKNSVGKNNKKSAIAHVGGATVEMDNNLFYHLTNGTIGLVYLGDTGTYKLYNNVIYSAAHIGTGLELATGGTETLIMKDNIISGFDYGIQESGTSSLTEDYNLVYGATTANFSGITPGAHDVQLDPKFMSPMTDFSLQGDSPAIDAGYDTGLAIDYVGAARRDDLLVPNTGAGTVDYYDIGAFEFVDNAASVPLVPTVDATSTSSITVIISANGNADWAEYAIYNQTLSKYVQADGTLGDTAVWQTRTLWGGDSGIINSGLSANTDYTYKIKARNGDYAETAFSASASESTPSSIPVLVTATALSTVSIKLDWVSGGSESKFNIYRNGASGVGVLIHSADDLTYTDTGLVASTSYIYYVYSVDDDGAESSGNISVTTSTLSDPVIDQTSNPSSSSTSSTVPSTSDFSTSSNSDEITFIIPSDMVMDANVTFEAPETLGGSQILTYTWDLGDGTILTGKNIVYQYQEPGQYIVTLSVTAQGGLTSVKAQTINVNPSEPTVENITTEGNDIVISGKSYPGTTVYLEIHSDPILAQVIADANGLWIYRLANAKETLGVGDHTVTASASYALADSTQLKSETSKSYDFKVSLDDGQTKVEMKKTRLWQIISIISGIVIILLLGFVVYRRKRGQRK